jgi:hypothetical protein
MMVVESRKKKNGVARGKVQDEVRRKVPTSRNENL